jgi:A-kinase anchor protein 1
MSGWYRAQIVEVFPDTDEVLLRFVDYGGYGRACCVDLRQIRSDFLSLEFQAVEVHLAHIVPKVPSSGWSSDALTFVYDITNGKPIEATVVGVTPDKGIPLVELYSTGQGKMMSVNQMLVDSKFANWAGRVGSQYANGSLSSVLPVSSAAAPSATPRSAQ